MAQKTKAAMPGRQCNTENKEQKQDTRPVAGGQRMSQRNFAPSDFIQFCTPVTAAMAQLGCTALQHTPYLSRCRGCEPVAHTLLLHTSLGVVQTSPLRSPVLVSSNIGCGTYTKKVGNSKGFQFCTKSAKPCYPEVGHYSLSASLAFLRCSAFSLRPQASNTHAEKLAPEFSALSLSTLASISSMSSWGNRICFLADLLLVLPVAICAILKLGVSTPYTKKMAIKTIDMGTHQNVWWVHTLFFLRCQNSEAQQCANTNWASDHKPLYEVTTMAELQSTQTRPEFTWLFLATPKHYPECAPVVIRFDADTESSARAAFPGWELVFAAKIRAQAPCRVSFFDYSTRRGWEFDSAASQGVRHA